MDAGAVPATSTNLFHMGVIQVKCYQCDLLFDRRIADYNRTKRQKQRHFCSRSCSAIYRNKHFPNSGNPANLNIGSDLDKYSPFRYFINAAKRRRSEHPDKDRYQEIDITLDYLLKLWGEQRGICPYSGHDMVLPPKMGANRSSPLCASLDRIDPSKGYIQGNVQFVTQFVNFGKNRYSHDDVVKFFIKK